MTTRELDLGTQKFLAAGTFGEVYRVDYLLPGDPTPLAYKKFTTDQAAQARSANAAVTFRSGLDEADRDTLDRYSTWPRDLVADKAGRICGLLMPLIPPEFFCQQVDPVDGQLTTKPREMSWLIATAQQRSLAQVDFADVDRTTRITLLTQLVYALGLLHKRQWVFGDLSFKNASFALDPPRLMLLDCDGAAALSNTSRQQFSTAFWDPPECPIKPSPGQQGIQKLQDDKTDVYKMGLAILRCLTPGRGAATSTRIGRLAGELDTEGTDLVARALSASRSDRPAAKELYRYLRKIAAARIVIPEVSRAELVGSVIIRGMDARIEWQIENADRVKILAGNNEEIPVDLRHHPTGYAFKAGASGPVSIQAGNRFGMASVELGELMLYELPSFDVNTGNLPRPRIPAIEAFQPPLESVLADRPGIGVGANVLQMPDLDVFGFVEESLQVGDAGAVSWPSLDDVTSEVSRTVTDLVAGDGSELATSVRQALRELVGSG